LTDFLDERDISDSSYIFDRILHHIKLAELGDEDLLTEIKRIDSLQRKSLFDVLKLSRAAAESAKPVYLL